MSRYSNQKRAKKAANLKVVSSSTAAKGSGAMSDVKLRKERMNAAIIQPDAAAFGEHLTGWLEATAYMRSRAGATTPDAAIPHLASADFETPAVRVVADDAVFAFCIVAAMNAHAAAADALEATLAERFGTAYPGIEAFNCCRKGIETGDALDAVAGGMIKNMLDEKAFDPRDTWNAGLRLMEKARKSNFAQELMPLLAKWHRDRWSHIITQQLFNLTRPRATVPPIEDVLSDNRNDQSFIASLLIAATGAVDLELDETYRAHLQGLARRD